MLMYYYYNTNYKKKYVILYIKKKKYFSLNLARLYPLSWILLIVLIIIYNACIQ